MLKKYWTSDELALLGENIPKCTLPEIAKHILPNKSYNQIRRAKIRYFPHLKREMGCLSKSNQNIGIKELKNKDSTIYQLLLGSMLGCGSVYSQSRHKKADLFTHYYAEMRGICFEDYVMWKHKMFNKLFGGSIQLNRGETAISYRSRQCNKLFGGIRILMYDENFSGLKKKKFIPEYMGRNIDYFGLLVFYMEKGKTNSETGHKNICVRNFYEKDVKQFVTNINKNLKIYVTLEGNGKNIIINKKSYSVLESKWKELIQKHNIPFSL